MRTSAFPDRPWAGLLYRDLLIREGTGGVLPGLAQLCCSCSRSQCQAQHLRTQPAAEELCSKVLGARSLQAAPYEQVKLDEAQRKKKNLDFILLPRFYFYFPGVVNEHCQLKIPPLSFDLLLTLEGR